MNEQKVIILFNDDEQYNFYESLQKSRQTIDKKNHARIPPHPYLPTTTTPHNAWTQRLNQVPQLRRCYQHPHEYVSSSMKRRKETIIPTIQVLKNHYLGYLTPILSH
jgi:hypothetical protein